MTKRDILIGLLISPIVVIIIIIIGLFILFMIPDGSQKYVEATNWNCDEDKFYSDYFTSYQNKIQELKVLYDIECTEILEQYNNENDNIAVLYLYNDLFTIRLIFANRDGYYGDYSINLFYYGENEDTEDDLEYRRRIVNLANDLTHYVAYDSKKEECENYFDKLYSECVEQDKQSASYTYHFDELVGYVGYTVAKSGTYSEYGYYYKMQKNSDANIAASFYKFEGLLKNIDR